jgi:RNA polymerase sigma-70 factor (ECF subfamily)
MEQDFEGRGRWLAHNVVPHEPLIRAVLRDLCVYDLDPEDILQEVYTRILSQPSLEAIHNPKQYALQIAKSLVVDHIRHMRVVSITFSGNMETLSVPSPESTAEERLLKQEEFNAVAGVVEKLPARCREVLLLRRIEGLSQREVAKRLGISEKAVEKHMSKGIQLLVKWFGRGGKPRGKTSNKKDGEWSENVG